MILAACMTKKSIYYGLSQSINHDQWGYPFVTQQNTEICSVIKRAVMLPLLVFVGTKEGGNNIVVYNIVERTSRCIDWPCSIVSLAIHPNKKMIVTLSLSGEIRYINVAQKKCTYMSKKVNQAHKSSSIFSDDHLRQGSSSLLSFSENGESLSVVLKNTLVVEKVSFQALYDIDYKRLMYIICALSCTDAGILKDIRQLIVFKIVQPYL